MVYSGSRKRLSGSSWGKTDATEGTHYAQKPELQKSIGVVREKGELFARAGVNGEGWRQPPPSALSDCLVRYQPVPELRSDYAKRLSEVDQPVVLG